MFLLAAGCLVCYHLTSWGVGVWDTAHDQGGGGEGQEQVEQVVGFDIQAKRAELEREVLRL
jgi:hypothetical protein